MGKFNKKATLEQSMARHPDAIVNHEGALAYSMSEKTKLMTIAVTCLIGESKFYESPGAADANLSNAVDAVLRTDPEFVLKLAAFCRNQMYLRSLPIYLLVKYANYTGPRVEVPNASAYVPQIVRRADELTEVVAAQMNMYPKKRRKSGGVQLPRILKNGLAEALNNFSEYNLAKYDRPGDVKIKDVLFLTHPKPKDAAQQEIFDKIAAGMLDTPETWEVLLSDWQSKFPSKRDAWIYIIDNVFNKDGKVNNYMAMLRNLNNILEEDVPPKYIDKVAEMLQDPQAVKASKQFPYRFLSAYNTIKFANRSRTEVDKLKSAIERALDISVENVPQLPGSTLVLIDVSSSMQGCTVSRKSVVRCADIACVFGVMTPRIVEKLPTVVAFGTDYRQIQIADSDRMLETANKIMNLSIGMGTNLAGPLQEVTRKGIVYDRIIILSDMQCHRYGAEALEQYRRQVNPNAYIYSVDLYGYGSALMPENSKNLCLMGGYSDKIFNFITSFEANPATMVERVDAWTTN